MTTITVLILIGFIITAIVICKFVIENVAKLVLCVLLCLICFCAWHVCIAKDGKTPDQIGTELVNKAGNVFDTATTKIEFFVDSQQNAIVKNPSLK